MVHPVFTGRSGEEYDDDDADTIISDHGVSAAVLAEGGGMRHRPGGQLTPSLSSGNHRIHVRSRMQKPLAPLPSGVMVGAGLEAAAQLGKSLVQRLVRSLSHGGPHSLSPMVRDGEHTHPVPRSHALSVDVSVACVGAGVPKQGKRVVPVEESPHLPHAVPSNHAASHGARPPRVGRVTSPVMSQV